MIAPTVFVGIDVSKDSLDIALRPSGERWQVAHDSRGIEGLLQRLGPLPEALVVLEATGGYEQALAAALASAGVAVVVANPRQVRDFARATGQVAKTDAIDAAVLALFAERVRPEPRPLPDEARQGLEALVTRRRQLIEMLMAEQNRLLHARRAGRRAGPSLGRLRLPGNGWGLAEAKRGAIQLPLRSAGRGCATALREDYLSRLVTPASHGVQRDGTLMRFNKLPV